jgi:DNA-binding response OmpR family regulator
MNASPLVAELELPEVSRPGPQTINHAGSDMAQTKPKRSLHILFIDDDPQVREFMAVCLAQFEHRVMAASGGKQGIDLFRAAMRDNQPYDVVITDLGMPEVDGRLVARTIRAESPRTPIIMMTGWGVIMKEEGETIPDVDVVVNKPPHMRELNELLLRMAQPA